MIWVDYIIISLMLIFTFLGLLKGAAKQAFSLLAWLAAVLVGIFFSHDLARLIGTHSQDPAAGLATAFIALFLITLIVTGLIGILLGLVLGQKKLSPAERMGGMLLGAAHGGLFVVIALLLTGLSVLPKSPWWRQSKLIPPFQTVSVWISQHFRSEFTKNIHYN